MRGGGQVQARLQVFKSVNIQDTRRHTAGVKVSERRLVLTVELFE